MIEKGASNSSSLHTTSVSDKYLKKFNQFSLKIALSKLFVMACISSIDSGRNLAGLQGQNSSNTYLSLMLLSHYVLLLLCRRFIFTKKY